MITQDIILKDQLWINQSKVKRLTSPVLCPQRYYLEEVTGELKRESTEAMTRGHYFEYKLWGTLPKEGNIPVLPGGRKKGSPSVIQLRLDQQAAIFPSLMDKYGIKIAQTNVKVEVPFNNEIFLFGTMDALVEYKGKPYIFDLKTTANVHSEFGDFAWGNFKTLIMETDANGVYSHVQTVAHNGSEMDLIQAHAYMYFLELMTGRRWGFLYGVFDYKATPGPEHKIIEIPFSEAARVDMIRRIGGTKYKLEKFKEMNYAAIPSIRECKDCRHLACTNRMTMDELPIDENSLPSLSRVQANSKSDPDESPF